MGTGLAHQKKCAVFNLGARCNGGGFGAKNCKLPKGCINNKDRSAKCKAAHAKECNSFKFKNSPIGCTWKKGQIKMVTEYYTVKEVPTYSNNAEPQAIVNTDITTTERIVNWDLKWKTAEEFEYYGDMEAAANDEAKFIEHEGECPHLLVRDCSGQCAPAYWIGNGLCDNGGKGPSGNKGAALWPNKGLNVIKGPACRKKVRAMCNNWCKDPEWTVNGVTKKTDMFGADKKKLSSDIWYMNRCIKQCNKEGKFQQAVVNDEMCIWYMPQLKSYGTKASHGVYNFNCPRFWYDGGDCDSKGAVITSEYNKRYATLKKKSTTFGLARNVVAVAMQNKSAVPVVAMAAIAVVAGVAMFAKKAMA